MDLSNFHYDHRNGDTIQHIENMLKLALKEQQQREVDKARQIYFDIIDFCRQGTIALDLSGIIAHSWCQLGKIYLQSKCFENAVDAYRKAIQVTPESRRGYYGMARVLHEKGDLPKAIACYRKALSFSPDSVDLYFHMGNALERIDQKTDAIQCYQRALSLDSSRSEIWQNLGNIYFNSEKFNDAVVCYLRALEKNPNSPGLHTNLGLAYNEMEDVEAALKHFKQALELMPESETVLKCLGIVTAGQGRDQTALQYYEKLSVHHPKFEYEVLAAMAAPIIYDSREMIVAYRKKLKDQLRRLQQKNQRLEDPYRQVGVVNFILGMHGYKEKEIRQQIAGFYLKTSPQLAWRSPFLKKSFANTKIRIGFVSNFLHQHTIGNLYHGLIANLSRNKFHVSIFHFSRKDDMVAKRINQSADQVHYLPKTLAVAREIISAQKLDILFYPELGMDPLTYFLSFARMAPVQIKRGFQITMGIPNIDYFISSKWAEPPDAKDHYSETLILLERIGYYYPRPVLPETIPTRKELGLPEDRILYACPQSLFKLHPDFDVVLGNILRKDSKGLLVLLKGKYSYWEALLLKRFQKSIPDVINRIIFVPRMPREKFISLFIIADAVLDPIFICGGNTSLECFSAGVPVVTWPSAYLPGRLTYGFYKQMGMLDCVAHDLDHYAELAVQLGNDKSWYNELKEKIKKRSSIFFEDHLAVREMENFFGWAVDHAYGINQNISDVTFNGEQIGKRYAN